MTDLAARARPVRTIRRFIAPALVALAVVWLSPACDNPACVFGPGGCGAAASASSNAAAATVPANHQWIEVGPPSVTGRIPSLISTTLGPDSPMAIVFSESMAAASVSGAIRLMDAGSGGFAAPVATASSLVADGRVLVIVPLQALSLGTTYDAVW